MNIRISNLEEAAWEPYWDSTVNPVKSDSMEIVKLSDGGIRIFNAGPAYSAQLAKNLVDFVYKPSRLTFLYVFTIDDCTEMYGQVIETDWKLTTSDGWTYDGSFQFLIAGGWKVQVGDPWVDAGYLPAPPKVGVATMVSIVQTLDHASHTNQIVSLNGVPISAPAIPAQRLGWQKSSLLTQLQLCQNHMRGAYSVKFKSIQYLADI